MNFVENIAFSPKYKDSPKNTLVFSLEMECYIFGNAFDLWRAQVNMNDLRKASFPKNMRKN